MNKNFIFTIIIAFLSIGCSKSTVILLDNGKKKNAVIVSTNKGSTKLNKIGSFVDLKDKEKAPSEVQIMSEKEINKRFSKVLAIAPKSAVSYILYFKPNSTKLTQESENILEDAIKFIAERTPCSVDIIGHTDTVGSNKDNMKVSLKRAKYIKSVVEKRDVKVIELATKGYGEEDLLVKTKDNTDEAKNRNVEIFIK